MLIRAICASIILLVFSNTLLYALDKNGNFKNKKEQDEYISLALKKMSKEINSQTPMMLDSETQMCSVLALGKSINFSVKLINVSSKDIDSEQAKKYLLGNLNDLVCKDQATRTLIDLGVSYIYLYFGNDDRLITRIAIEEYKCN